ncbi:periplasmic heavy metal sensor [Brevundimonas sp.]|uniref:periplasmic heavy metal sensor n=1 Tax=Brevundimonas sp. TaxID=1871086 RepID=UPI0025B920F6|nr:periplasmic heavy metal sensor [Brevundimonas sp.]
MSNKTLKIALAVSVALNLFAVAGGVAYGVSRAQMDRKIEAQNTPGRQGGFGEMLASLPPEIREKVHTSLRESALAARPDFEAARAARREAVVVAGADVYDAARVQALLEQSRSAELRGRARLENEAIAVLAELTPEQRKTLSPILQRKGGAHREPHRDGPPNRPPHPDAPR